MLNKSLLMCVFAAVSFVGLQAEESEEKNSIMLLTEEAQEDQSSTDKSVDALACSRCNEKAEQQNDQQSESLACNSTQHEKSENQDQLVS